MVGILILIPLVVLLVVGLVTSFVSVNAYIGVESVELDKETLTIKLGETYALDGDGGLFKVTVLPERAQNKTYEWTISNVRSRDANFADDDNGKDGFWYVELLDANGNHVDTITSGGFIRANVYCNFELTVTAETHSDTCAVVVGGDVTEITLDSEKALRVGESAVLTPRYTPLDGVVYNAEWVSENPDVASVDRNGIVTAVREGETRIRLKAENSAGEPVVSNYITVTVSAGISAYGDIISVHEREFELSRIGVDADDVVADATFGATVSGGVFRFNEGETRAVLAIDGGGRTPDALVVNLCGEDDIEIVESGALGNYILEVNGEPLYLTARYASVFKRGKMPVVTWSISNDEIASVDDEGTVRGLSSGEVTVSAQTPDGTSAAIELQVQRKVTVLVGAVTDASLEAGLARETVFASMKYDADALVGNTFTVGVLYPMMYEGEDEESFYEAFSFTTDRPDLAWFDTGSGDGELNNILHFNASAIERAAGKSGRIDIKVTVSAKYPKYANLPEYTTFSFTLTVVSGVAVTTDAELRSAQAEGYATVLENDITMENNTTVVDGVPTRIKNIPTYNSVYGNGHTISAEKGRLVGKTEPVFQVNADDVVISNITIRPNEFDESGADGGDMSIEDASQFDNGYCVRYNINERLKTTGETGITQIKGGRIEYSVLENASTLIQVSGAEVELEGCIMRNTGGVGIHVRNTYERVQHYNNLTLTNSIMSNMVGTSINFDYNNASYTETADTRSTFTQKGFLDIYNWQDGESLVLIPRDTLEGIGLGGELIDILYSTLQRLLVTDPSIESFRRDVGGVTYLHLGFITMGLSGRSCLFDGYLPDGRRVGADGKIEGTDEYADPDDVSWNMTLEDGRFRYFSSDDISGLDILGGILKNPMYVFGYDDSTTDLVPGSTYTINSRLIARLHGETI